MNRLPIVALECLSSVFFCISANGSLTDFIGDSTYRYVTRLPGDSESSGSLGAWHLTACDAPGASRRCQLGIYLKDAETLSEASFALLENCWARSAYSVARLFISSTSALASATLAEVTSVRLSLDKGSFTCLMEDSSTSPTTA